MFDPLIRIPVLNLPQEAGYPWVRLGAGSSAPRPREPYAGHLTPSSD